jgi:uncharacterized DUF497 family protein
VSAPFTYRFDWDPAKATANRHKHGVSFEQAAGVFRDPLALSRYDEGHSEDEERWLTLGVNEHGVLLVVSHTFEELSAQEARVRLISAREATATERRQYEGGSKPHG